MDPEQQKKLAIEIEQDMKNKTKLDDMYGPKETFLFMFIGILTFMVLFFTFQYFATFNEGIETNYQYLFCNSHTENSDDTVTKSDSANFEDSSL